MPTLSPPGAEREDVTVLVERLARMEATLGEVAAELRELRRARGG